MKDNTIYVLKYFFAFCIILFFSSCNKINHNIGKNQMNDLNEPYSSLVFPDSLINETLFGHFKYFYELSDTVRADLEDFRVMKIYAKLTKEKINPKTLNIRECDSFFAITNNFVDTLRTSIFLSTKGLKGAYFLSAKGVITSIPAHYGKIDSINQIMLIREFDFMKKDSIIIN